MQSINRKSIVILATLCVATILPCGCGKKLPMVPVSGKVTWQGKPLPSGDVCFMPTKSKEGLPKRPATATIKSDGTYQVSSFEPGDGLLPGEYNLIVRSYLGDANPNIMGIENNPQTIKSRIPERYGNPTTSGLHFTVPHNASNAVSFNIDLTP